MKYIIFNWKSYLNLRQTQNLSKLIASFSKSRKNKIISAPSNFFTLIINSKFPKNIISAQNIDTHGLGANTGYLNQDIIQSILKAPRSVSVKTLKQKAGRNKKKHSKNKYSKKKSSKKKRSKKKRSKKK